MHGFVTISFLHPYHFFDIDREGNIAVINGAGLRHRATLMMSARADTKICFRCLNVMGLYFMLFKMFTKLWTARD